jgi:phosphoribosyl 1,2-cyclic phosphodiesterase
MIIRFWGTRGTRPTPGRRTLRYGGNTTCLELRSRAGDLVIIDSGSGIAELGGALANGAALDAPILITHTHWDHIQGFPFFGPAFQTGTKIQIVGPKGSIKSLQAAFEDQMDPAYFPTRLDQVPAELEFVERSAGETFEAGGMAITPYQLNHPILTFGYRIEEDGRRLVFATDNELGFELAESGTGSAGAAVTDRAAIVEWCRGADLLVHDAQYSAEEYQSKVGWGHSSMEDVLTLSEEAEVRQVAFFHHDPGHSDDDIDALVEAALGNHRRRRGTDIAAFPAAEETQIEV